MFRINENNKSQVKASKMPDGDTGVIVECTYKHSIGRNVLKVAGKLACLSGHTLWIDGLESIIVRLCDFELKEV